MSELDIWRLAPTGWRKVMFGKKSRLERENDTLDEEVHHLKREIEYYRDIYNHLQLRYLRNLRDYRYSQKANERRKRSNRRLRKMLDDVGWPKNDREDWIKLDNKSDRLVPRRLP